MPRRVFLSDRAEADLTAVRRWQLQPGSGVAAKRRVKAILAAVRRLREHPCLHPRGAHRGTRELHVAGHTVVYEVTPDTGRNATAGDVTVLRVFGPGQSRERL